MKTLLFVFLGLFVPLLNFGNDFRYLRTQEGLVDGEVTSIVQDSTGNIWIGSYSGLTKYDGLTFEVFRPVLGNESSLPDKKIKRLLVDSENNLWVSSDRILSIYNQRSNTFRIIEFDRDNSTDLNINYISEFKKHLIIHTVEGFYVLPFQQIFNINYKAKKRLFVQSGAQINPYFRYLFAYEDKLLAINKYGSQPSQVYNVDFLFSNTDTLLDLNLLVEVNENINSVEFISNENCLYFATNNGLIPYSLETHEFIKKTYFKGQNIKDVIYTKNNKIYCSLTYPKLFYIDLHTGLTGEYAPNPSKTGSLLNSEIMNLFEDFSGNLWIGHQGQGISILNLHQKEFLTFRSDPIGKNTLNSNTILSFSESEKEYIIGCRHDGINVISKIDLYNNVPNFKSIKIPVSTDAIGTGVWDIAKVSDSRYWLATESGLFQLVKNQNTWSIKSFGGIPRISDLVWKLLIDKSGNIWCGTFNGGLILIPNPERNPENKYYRYLNVSEDNNSISDNYVKEIFIDSQNRFWIGTLNGLNCLKDDYEKLDLSGNSKPILNFKRYVGSTKSNNYLNNNEINSIIESYDGKIWISTNGGGINILNPDNEEFSNITIDDGLPSNDIFGMLSDRFGNMWISTNNGLVLYRFLRDSVAFTIFDQYDGIQGEVFMVGSHYKASDGSMFFGGDNGFTSFIPENIELNKIKPKIAFSELYFQNKKINVGDTVGNDFILENTLNYSKNIVLPFKRNYFKIVVSTLHFQAPLKNKFSYKLDNLMNSWVTVPTADETIEFANLPFGKYKLLVKALSSDNIESGEIKILNIEIEPPWYKTWYMTVIFFLFGFLIIFGFVFILINRQKFIYQKRLDEMTIENNENRMMFLTNIAHELRTPLSLIIAPIEDLVRNNADEENLWKNHLQLIYRNSNYLLRLINQIIDFRKLNTGKLNLNLKNTNIVRVVKDVVLNFKGFESKRKIKLYLQVPADEINVLIDAQKIEEVLYNLLSNAFKNTFDNHSITVSMSIENSMNDKLKELDIIRISVFNEGEEISIDNSSKIFERFYKINESSDGAGIGLSFAKSLVELHEGKLYYESVAGAGVIFYIELPFITEGKAQGITNVLKQKYQLIRPDIIRDNNERLAKETNITALIIEDNEELRGFLKMVLSRWYRCFDASNGVDGWEIVKKEKPSIILSDIILPKLNGLELCKKVKENKDTCHIPVILLTAKNEEEQQINGYKFGADAYVTKPFDINILLSQVSRLIKNRELIREKYRTQNFMVEVESNFSKDEEFVQTVRKLLEENITDPEFNVNRLSQQLNISTTQLYRKLKHLTGYSPVEFIRIIKLQKAYNLLNQRNKTVKEVCYLTGFNNLSYFIKCFKEQFDVTPASFRDYGKIKQKAKNKTNITEIQQIQQI